MAKVDRNTIQKALNEANELEYELSFDEQCRELDEFDHWDDNWTGYDVEHQDYYHHFEEDCDWRNNDFFDGDY